MATNTNAPLVIFVVSYFSFVALMFGLIGMGLQTSGITCNAASCTGIPTSQPSLLGFLGEFGNFFSGIFFTIGSIPFWATILAFSPSIVGMIYVIFSYLRGI
jgi:hypothetical protein